MADKFFVQRGESSYHVNKYYEDTGRIEWWRTFDSEEDAEEFCHYMNGGRPDEYILGKRRLYKWKLVRVY